LIDERWLELFLAKLRDTHDFQDKKMKLASGSKKQEDPQVDKDKDVEKDKKRKKGGSKGGGKGEEAKTSAPT